MTEPAPRSRALPPRLETVARPQRWPSRATARYRACGYLQSPEPDTTWHCDRLGRPRLAHLRGKSSSSVEVLTKHERTVLGLGSALLPPVRPGAAGGEPGSAAPESTAAFTVHAWDGDAEEWDRFVGSDAHSTFCHLAGWREIVGDGLRHECRYLVACDGGGLWRGALPLVRVKSRLLGHYLISMPFLNYGGPLGMPAAQAALAATAVAEARRSGADLLEFRVRHPTPLNLTPSHRKLTVILDLPRSVDELWDGTFDHKLRNKIRRAQRELLEPRFGPAELDSFYEIFARRMRELGTPVLPRSFFEGLARVFTDETLFGAVYWRGQPLAAGCGFVWRDEFEMTWSAQLVKHKDKAPNLALYWSFLQHLIRQGVRRCNFGRSTPGSGTHEFKRQWGGADIPLPWLTWSRSGAVSPPSPERPAYRVATALWSRLPLAVTKLAGPTLARLLP